MSSCICSCSLLSGFTAAKTRSAHDGVHSTGPRNRIRCSVGGVVAELTVTGVAEPLLLNAVRGLEVERPPVWLMRQAGRYMKSYQTMREKYPSFRERSENVDLVVELSLQPWNVFKLGGVILFSHTDCCRC